MTAFVATLKEEGDVTPVWWTAITCWIWATWPRSRYLPSTSTKIHEIDVLILNAAVMMITGLTHAQKLETQVGINVVGHFFVGPLLLLDYLPSSLAVQQASTEMAGAQRFDFDWFITFAKKNCKPMK
jgi:NAD(P)-dependent dehydrogenase (short-subunit alcohol dehydrogenase family)